MPVYNSAKYLEEAIQSILNQSYKNFEFIIVNNGSTDNSLDIIKKYANIDTRIKFYTENIKGISIALNTAIKHSSGDFIFRMDSDDISINNRIFETLKYMISNDLDICGSFIKKFKKNNFKLIKYPINHNAIILAIEYCSPIAHPTVCFNKRILNQIIYENCIAEDWILWKKLRNNKMIKFGNVPQCLLYYRTGINSLTYQNVSETQFKYNKAEIRKNFITIKYYDITFNEKFFIIKNYIGSFSISKFTKAKLFFYYFCIS